MSTDKKIVVIIQARSFGRKAMSLKQKTMSKKDSLSFPCSGCGSCCKRIKNVVEYLNVNEDDIAHFPYNWDESGRCEKLTEDNKCSVYDNRPYICNIDNLFQDLDMPREMFTALNITACNLLMDEDGVSKEFRISKQTI